MGGRALVRGIGPGPLRRRPGRLATCVIRPARVGRSVAIYDKKLAEGKTRKEALRSLKRQISDAIFARLQPDARRAAAAANSPGGQPGERLWLQRGRLSPEIRGFCSCQPRVMGGQSISGMAVPSAS